MYPSLIERGIRQGSLISCAAESLSDGALAAIKDGRSIAEKRNKPIGRDHLILVLSQDCDINQQEDPYIELLPFKKIKPKQFDQRLQAARNFRKIQLKINEDFWLLEADLISIVPKALLDREDLVVVRNLCPRDVDLVLDWRTGRYKRRPLPDRFNQDFLFGYLKNKDTGLDDYLQRYRDEIIDLYAYVSPDNEDHADQYFVSVTALIAEGCPDDLKSEISIELMRHWRVLHDSANSLRMTQVDPELLPIEAFEIPQEPTLRMSEFTFLDAAVLRRITLDYLCFGELEDE